MESITTDLCVYCLDKACETRKTELYEVGLCEKHTELTNIEIDEIVGDEPNGLLSKLFKGSKLFNTVKVYPKKHQLQYSTYSGKISWCPICKEHFYSKQNEVKTTIASSEHYHIE